MAGQEWRYGERLGLEEGGVNSPEATVIQKATESIQSPWWKRVRWWAWVGVALIWAVYVWAGLIPLYYLKQIQVPPFEQLERTEGKVFFKHIRGKNGGYQLGLELPDGTKKLFTCSVGFGTDFGCVSIVKAEQQFGRKFSRPETPGSVFTKILLFEELAGLSGTVWWYQMPSTIGHTRSYAVRVDIDGKQLRSRDEVVERLRHDNVANTRFQFWVMTFMYAFLTYAVLYRGVKRNG